MRSEKSLSVGDFQLDAKVGRWRDEGPQTQAYTTKLNLTIKRETCSSFVLGRNIK